MKRQVLILSSLLLLLSGLKTAEQASMLQEKDIISSWFQAECQDNSLFLADKDVLVIDLAAFQTAMNNQTEGLSDLDWHLASYGKYTGMAYPVYVTSLTCSFEEKRGLLVLSYTLTCAVEKGNI
jgi:hypothetical protein